MNPALCIWCSGPHPDHHCQSKERRDYQRAARLHIEVGARRRSVAFSSPRTVVAMDMDNNDGEARAYWAARAPRQAGAPWA